jgi:hypothetical protein
MGSHSSATVREHTPHANLTTRAGRKSAALLVLMSKIENATYPRAVANIVKHFAFTRCGELNLGHMVDAQIATLEAELLAGTTRAS